jgi:hypothetical protein
MTIRRRRSDIAAKAYLLRSCSIGRPERQPVERIDEETPSRRRITTSRDLLTNVLLEPSLRNKPRREGAADAGTATSRGEVTAAAEVASGGADTCGDATCAGAATEVEAGSTTWARVCRLAAFVVDGPATLVFLVGAMATGRDDQRVAHCVINMNELSACKIPGALRLQRMRKHRVNVLRWVIRGCTVSEGTSSEHRRC